MTALGPRTEAALKEGPKTNGESILDSTIVATYCETQQQFARRVALIAVQEERERCAKICEDLDSRTIISEDRQGSAIECAAAIREGR